MVMESVFFEVQTECLTVTKTGFGLKGFSFSEFLFES
jgi:hypothetical protein